MFELKNILIITSVVLICSLVLPGCLENQEENRLQVEDVQIKDFKWTETKEKSGQNPQKHWSSFEIIIKSDYDGDVDIVEITINGQRASGCEQLHRGENLIHHGAYFVQDPTTKERGELVIKSITQRVERPGFCY